MSRFRPKSNVSRRGFLASAGAFGIAVHLGDGRALAASGPLVTKTIPNGGERLPVIGMGSWLTFDVRDEPMPMTGKRSPLFGMALVKIGPEAAEAAPLPSWTATPKAPDVARKARRETLDFGRKRDMIRLLEWPGPTILAPAWLGG